MRLWELFTGHASKKQSLAEADSMLSLVVAAAGLTANVGDIDPLLDKVRIITAKLGPDQTPSPAQEKTLVGVYLHIEAYLTTSDPVRSFSKEDIRKRVRPWLRRRIEQYEAKEGAIDA